MRKLRNVHSMTAGDFYRAFPVIANEKAVTAITRHGAINGFYVPFEQYNEYLKHQHSVKKRGKSNDSKSE